MINLFGKRQVIAVVALPGILFTLPFHMDPFVNDKSFYVFLKVFVKL